MDFFNCNMRRKHFTVSLSDVVMTRDGFSVDLQRAEDKTQLGEEMVRRKGDVEEAKKQV